MALVTEGAGDDAFLPPVVLRSARELYPDADVGVRPVRAASGPAGLEATVAALTDELGSFNLVVVHHDGATDPDREVRRCVEPLRSRWHSSGHMEPVAPVVPVRETETWALADATALCRVLGVSWDDRRLGLPSRRRDLESVVDPKRVLRELFTRAGGWNPAYLERLGRLVSLKRLRELSAFQRWENDLAEALQTLPGFVQE